MYSSFRMYSSTMSISGWICSILSTRHMKCVALRVPPNVPPTHFSATAFSTRLSAVSAKHCSFQYGSS